MANEQVNYKSMLTVCLIAMNCALGSFFFGYCIGILNLQENTIMNIYGILPDEYIDLNKFPSDIQKKVNLYYSILTSVMPLGAGLAAFLSSKIMNILGRRKTLILADIISIAGCGIFVIPYVEAGIIARFLQGMGVGLNSAVVPVYINEITPTALTGLAGSFNQGQINFGIIIANLLCFGFYSDKGSKVIPQNEGYWSFVMLFPIITCSIRLVVMCFIYNYETPTGALMMGNSEEAKRTVEFIYLDQYQEENLTIFKGNVNRLLENKLSMVDMFKKNYRYQTILGCLTQFFQQLSGINAITFYSAVIYQSIFADKLTQNILTVVQGVVATIFSFVCGALMTKFGRKTLLVGGQFGCAVLLTAVGIFTLPITNQGWLNAQDALNYLTIASIYGYLIAFSLSLGPIAWVYNADILPEQGIAIATLTNWTFTFIIGLTFPSIKDAVGIYSTFFGFAVFCILGGVLFIIYLKETFGLNKEAIQNMFQQNQNKDYRVLPEDKVTSQSDNY